MRDSRVVKCRECSADIVFLQSAKDPEKRVPVDANGVLPQDEVYESGRHISHFKTCSNPGRFSKGRR